MTKKTSDPRPKQPMPPREPDNPVCYNVGENLQNTAGHVWGEDAALSCKCGSDWFSHRHDPKPCHVAISTYWYRMVRYHEYVEEHPKMLEVYQRELKAWEWRNMEFSELKGKTLLRVNGIEKYSADVIFFTEEGNYVLKHDNDCCESVSLEDFDGDPSDLVGLVLEAEEVDNVDDPGRLEEDRENSYTWTFYKIATAKGHITLRWYGSSNGNYSESVRLRRVL